jgi:hypothetical protein
VQLIFSFNNFSYVLVKMSRWCMFIFNEPPLCLCRKYTFIPMKWSPISVDLSSQVAKINRNLRPFHGNKSVFPTKTQLGLVKNKHAPMIHFDKYTYEKLLKEKSTKTEKVTVEYTWADLCECLDKHMKSVRDCYSGLKPGFSLGPEGLCLGLVLLGDHGGI